MTNSDQLKTGYRRLKIHSDSGAPCPVAGWRWFLCLPLLSLGALLAVTTAGQAAPGEALVEVLSRLRTLPEDSAAERLDLAEGILERVETGTDTRIEAEAHIIRGAALLKLARYQEAIAALERGRELAHQLGEDRLICDSLRAQATVSFYLGEFNQTVALAEEGLRLAEAPELAHKAWRLTNLLAAVRLRRGDFSGALNFYLRALSQQEKLGDAEVEASILNNISGVYMQMSEYGKAIEALERCRRIMEAMGNRELLADTLSNLGTVHRERAESEGAEALRMQEDLAQARLYHDQALNLRQELQMGEKIALSHHSLGRTLRALGETGKARFHLEQSLALNRQLGLRPKVAGVLAPLASLFIDLGQYDQAVTAAAEGAAISEELGLNNTWLENLRHLAESHEKRGDSHAALAALRQAWDVNQEINDAKHQRKLVEVQTQLEVREKAREIEMLTKDNELKTLALKQQRHTRWALIAGLIFLVLLLLLLISRFRLKAQHRSQAEEVKVLRGLLPMCSVCKKIRDDGGNWNHLESYIDQHSEARLSHGICPVCREEYYPKSSPAP